MPSLPGSVVFGFGDGWNELEYNPTTGELWRWSSDRSAIRVRSEGHAVALTLRGEIEEATSSHVVVRAGNAVAADFDVGRTFSRTVLIPAASLPGPENAITIESECLVRAGGKALAFRRSPPPWLEVVRMSGYAGFLARQSRELPNGIVDEPEPPALDRQGRRQRQIDRRGRDA